MSFKLELAELLKPLAERLSLDVFLRSVELVLKILENMIGC